MEFVLKRVKYLQNSKVPTTSLDNIEIYKNLFTYSSNPILTLDRDLNVYGVNESLCELTGYKEDEISYKKLISVDYFNLTNSSVKYALNGQQQICDTVIVTKSMKKLDIKMTLIPIEIHKEVIGVFAVLEDLTEVKQLQCDLLRVKESLHHAQMIGNTGSWDYDVIEDEAYWSNQMYAIFGLEDINNFIPTYDRFFDFVHPDDKKDLTDVINNSIKFGTTLNTEFRIFREVDGEERFISQQANAILDESGKTVRLIGTCHDITEQKITERQLRESEKQYKKAEEKIKHIANHDYLTDLSNRMMFDKILAKKLNDCKKNKEKFAVLYLDMDRFKNINDTLGHFVGDELIKQISSRLKDVAGDDRIFRVGGDEFIILLSNMKDDHSPLKVARKITGALNPVFVIKEYELYITTSIGISIFPESGKDEETLIKSATTALARAKQLGKNNIQVHTRITNDEAYKGYYLETEMRKALEYDQFEVYYQPRVYAKTGKLLGAEALIRWNHPEWGIVSPGDFIPLAEESGFIHEIGEFVITTVCNQLKEWQRNHFAVIPISVNVSARSFYKIDFVSNIVSIIENADIDARLIELEITESSFLDNMDKVIEVLIQLKQYGIKVALDDFGTGFSSLTHLKALNIDTIKIDRSFIQNITESTQDETITLCIIQLAQGLKLDVVAEGVETKEQLELLQQKGCHQIQGFLYSKPIPTKEFNTILKKGFLCF